MFSFERGIDTTLERDAAVPVLELPSVDDTQQTEFGLFFEEREPTEKLPGFKGLEQKRVFVDEYRK